MKPQHYTGGTVTEQPDGSGVLEVRTARGQALLIHFAPHVYADLGFLFYQKFANQKAPWTASETRRRAEVRVSRG